MTGLTVSGAPDSTASKSISLSLYETVRIWFRGLKLRRLALWREVQMFSQWIELEATRLAGEMHQRYIRIELTQDGVVDALIIGQIMYNHELDDFPLLWKFLFSIGVSSVVLDARLERNQINDVLRLLYSCNNKIRDYLSSTRLPGSRSFSAR